ncbi:MAG: endo-beta-N-acetylglucosaminidase, partial [bacterium]
VQLPSTLVPCIALAWAAAGVSVRAGGGFPSNQPFASYWFPSELLTWSPVTDPDAPYNRGAVPLADRFTNPDIQVNPNARDGEARVAAIGVMYPSTSNNPSQGSDQFDVYAFGYWPYVDYLVFWGGSAGEGLILAPSADVIDAGHRHGVPVLGTIFFPPNVFGGQIQWVHDLVQKTGSTFPVADKLIEVESHYGFDGWFLNQETNGGDSTLALAMQEFLVYYQANKAPDHHMMWYDAMIDDGSVSWQNELNARNEMFFEDQGRVSDSIFLNFLWANGTRLEDSAARALSLGRSPYDVYAGINVQPTGYNTSVNWAKLFPDGMPHTTSMGFYGTEWTYASSSDPADFYDRESTFWVGQNDDPSDTDTPLAWKGVAHTIPAKSSVNDVPFVTSFNAGQGDFYAVDGEILRATPWNNRSLQDVLPTWRWIRQSAGTPLAAALDFGDAYDGGACLRFTGALDASNATHVPLYATSLLVPPNGRIAIAYKTGAIGSTSMQVGIAFESDESAFTFHDVGPAPSAGWNFETIDVGAHAGQTIAILSLRFATTGSIPGYDMRVGRLGLLDGPADLPAPPSGALVEDAVFSIDRRTASVRLRWSPSPDPTYTHYVYRRNPDASRTFLGGTPNDALFVAEVVRAGAETTAVLEIEAVSPELGRSAPETTSVFWGLDPPNTPPIANANGPYCGTPGQGIQLHSDGTGDADGAIVSYLWDFGDGDTSPLPDPIHEYAAAGEYEVVLAVADDLGGVALDTTFANVVTTAPSLDANVAWYPFDEGEGSVAADSSGNGNDGAIFGATWTAGQLGAALDFDGVDDWVLVADYPKPESTITVSAWVRADSRPPWASIAKNWATQKGSFHLGLFSGDGDLQVTVGEADEGTVDVREGAESPLPLGSWQHVALVADGAEVRLYRDGHEVGAAPYDGTLKTTRPGIGIGVKLNNAGNAPNANTPAHWDGRIDDVRIWDRALCQTEIEALLSAVPTDAPIRVAGGAVREFALGQNHPNPLGRTTEIRYALPRATRVSLAVYDVAGRIVASLVDREQEAGTYRVQWHGRNRDGREVAPGVYFYRMTAGGFSAVRKLVVIR